MAGRGGLIRPSGNDQGATRDRSVKSGVQRCVELGCDGFFRETVKTDKFIRIFEQKKVLTRRADGCHQLRRLPAQRRGALLVLCNFFIASRF